MDNLLAITKVLGEENEKRFKDAVTDLLIEQVKDDLENMSNYLIDWEELFEEIRAEIKEEFRDKVRTKYMKAAEEKLSEVFGENHMMRNENEDI